jgi:iron complex outermembrane recepter protein
VLAKKRLRLASLLLVASAWGSGIARGQDLGLGDVDISVGSDVSASDGLDADADVSASAAAPDAQGADAGADGGGDVGSDAAGDRSLSAMMDAAAANPSHLGQVDVAASALAQQFETNVSTVERRENTLGRTPAAVFVITNEMIRRSGVKTIPEALRLAPGVQVAKVNANQWAIGIRNVNALFNTTLLVQIDGRSVYSPLFGGTFWDVQDYPLEDIERIEVIRGPGATVWGENAVDGVINIITKSAHDTQGTFVEAGGGSELQGLAVVRQGGAIGQDGHYRVYGKFRQFDTQQSVNAFAPNDDWRTGQGGFRADWNLDAGDSLTIQGDMYNGMSSAQSVATVPLIGPQAFNFDFRNFGANVLTRFNRVVDEDRSWRMQAYYDRTERHFQGSGIGSVIDTYDLDFQYNFALGERHRIVSGIGYRFLQSTLTPEPGVLQVRDEDRYFDVPSAFVQDEITLVRDRWAFIIGSKISDNDFTGTEAQPSARLLWTPTKRFTMWSAVSRAVHTQSIGSSDIVLSLPAQESPIGTIFPTLVGNPGLAPQELIAYELGYRHQPVDELTVDGTIFYHDYQELRGRRNGPLVPIPPFGFGQSLVLDSSGEGSSYGAELAVTSKVSDTYDVVFGYTFLQIELNAPLENSENNSPQNNFYTIHSWRPIDQWGVDCVGRYVDSVTEGFLARNVPSYLQMDLRLSWRPNKVVEAEVIGRNLLDHDQREGGNDGFLGIQSTGVQREVYGGLIVRY